MEKWEFSKKTEEIYNKYKKIHKIFFTYGIFFVLALFSWIKLYAILSAEENTSIEQDPLQIQKEVKIQEFLYKIERIEKQNTLTGPIALWQFEETENYIESFNNLLYYKGFLIPRFFWVSKSAPLQSIDYFMKGTYTIEELDTLFKNIFIGSNKNTNQTPKNISFPLSKGITEEFNLQCVFQSKITNIICNIFINNFLEKSFIYNIESDIDTFSNVMQILLQEKKYNKKACEQLLYYTYYTEKENTTIEKLIQQCEPMYQQKYRLFLDFTEVQKELFSKFISNKIYKDDSVNIYKLISFQQIINDDITNKIINIDRINGYFLFLQEILKKNKIWLFYKELTYFFNNYYLKKAIENIEITSKITNKTEIDNISKQIISINSGNPLIWYKWLKEEINKNLIEQAVSITEENNTEKDYEQKIESLLLQIKDIEIKQKFLSGNNILIYWIRKIESKVNNYSQEMNILSIPTKLRLEENKNTLTLKQIMLEWYDDISQTINKLIESQKRSFADLQRYMIQNSFLFWETSSKIDEVETEKICKELGDKLINQEIKTCNTNKVDIEILRKNKVITMVIVHDNFLLKNIDISDPEAKIVLDQYINNPDIVSQITYDKVTKTDFITFIQKTVEGFLWFIPKDDQNFEGSTNTMIIIERIKKYLGIQVNDIVEKNEKILVDFTLWGIPFLWYYNILDHKIFPLYFKEANSSKTPVAIKNIVLTLTDSEKSFLTIFTLQPLEVIKQYSPEEYLLYQKFISEK